MNTTKALLFNFLSALTAIAGGIIGFYFFNVIQAVSPLAVAFTAGVFIYIACSDLIPESHKDFKKQKKWMHSLSFVLGILTIYFFGIIFQH